MAHLQGHAERRGRSVQGKQRHAFGCGCPLPIACEVGRSEAACSKERAISPHHFLSREIPPYFQQEVAKIRLIDPFSLTGRKMGMIYGYIRVSTDKQTTENQRFEILKFCDEKRLQVDHWV
jgi:hypothetical protein